MSWRQIVILLQTVIVGAIVVIFLAMWPLKERDRARQKFASAAAAIVGLTLIFWK